MSWLVRKQDQCQAVAARSGSRAWLGKVESPFARKPRRVHLRITDLQPLEGVRNLAMKSASSQPTWVEIRTVAGPSSVVQCVFSGGPFTTASQVTPDVRSGHNGPPP